MPMGFEVGIASVAEVALIAEWAAREGWNPGRTVALDGVVAQQPNYRRSGFRPAWTTTRFEGAPPIPDPPAGIGLVDARAVPFDALAAFDRRHFGAPRDAFLAAWISLAERHALVAMTDAGIVGFAVLRRAPAAARLGPVFASDAEVATALVSALAHESGAQNVAVDAPGINPRAAAWAESLGWTPTFETARMYTGPAHTIDTDGLFGITSLELG
ncbi:hypothetical protein A8L33_03265 [Microbacterium aurantiacum]|nr:hypothetical protein A8L33_03265 [Microbacterium chocolatum]